MVGDLRQGLHRAVEPATSALFGQHGRRGGKLRRLHEVNLMGVAAAAHVVENRPPPPTRPTGAVPTGGGFR